MCTIADHNSSLERTHPLDYLLLQEFGSETQFLGHCSDIKL